MEQNEKLNMPGKRGIRMDFYVEEEDGRIFDVEMQKRNIGNIPKRTRFYQALLDAPLLTSGEKGFDNLNPTYIVIICGFDLYGLGKYRYTFENQCREVLGLPLGDERLRHLHSKIKDIKSSTLIGVDYMKMEERDRLIKEEALKKGLNKGETKGIEKTNQLIQLLIKYSRTDEIERAVSDKEYQNKLFKEFNL